MPKKETSLKDALNKAQNLCSKQEKCIFDIRKKLFDWKLPIEKHEEVIESLVNDKFINEERYASYYTKEKFSISKWGKIKIEYALKQKGIPGYIIKNGLSQIPESDYENTLEFELIKKLKTIKDNDEYTVKSKLTRFALSRGFENGKVFDMVSSIMKKYG